MGSTAGSNQHARKIERKLGEGDMLQCIDVVSPGYASREARSMQISFSDGKRPVRHEPLPL